MKIQKYQPVHSIKPSQFAVGMHEVEYKILELTRMKKKSRKKFIDSTPIPVVIAPWKEFYAVDHHHFLFACSEANVKKVRVNVILDFSKRKMTYHQFWLAMRKRQNAHLYDQFGEGPRSPLYLPSDVRGMGDDPYRSLAWVIRKEGAYEKTDQTFAEFIWADFLRKHGLLEKQGKRGIKDAIKKAIRLARSSKASRLPGFIDLKKIEAKK